MKTPDELIREIMEGDRTSDWKNSNGVIFTDDGPEGYFSKQEFVTELLQRRGTATVRHLTTMFDNMSIGRELKEMPEVTTRDGEKTIWVKFNFGKVRQNLPIPPFARLHDLIIDYANGKLKGTKPFQQLLEDATRNYQG